MIIICEPQCKGMSHEKVNSGFIYGLRLAYPEQKILFFAHASHIQAIKEIFELDNIMIDHIEYRSIKFNANKAYNIFGIIRYYFLFQGIFKELLYLKVSKIIFLSQNPIILFTIKKLKQYPDCAMNRIKTGCAL